MSNVTKPVMLDDTGKSVAQALGNVATAINNMDKVQWGQIKGTLSNQTDLKNNLNSLQSQIDNFTALTDGSTTGDAELTNIRVDSSGHTYNTAGDAVRAIDAQVNALKTGFDGVEYDSPVEMVQGCDEVLDDKITDLKSAISEISGTTRNLFDKSSITAGNIDASGNITSSTTVWYSDFIDVQSKAFTVSSASKPSDSVVRIAYYNSSKVFVSREVVGVSSLSTLIIRSSNTYPYIRVACANGFEDALQIEIGTSATEYVPHTTANDLIARDKANGIDYYNEKCIPTIWHLTSSNAASGNVSGSDINWSEDSFSFKGTTGDDYFQTNEFVLNGSTTYLAEVFCDAESFEVYMLADYGSGTTFTQFNGSNKERAFLEFTTPSSGIVRFRFSNKVANVDCVFVGFKVYKKGVFVEELFSGNNYPYVSDKRINFEITGVDNNAIPCTLMLPTNYSETGEPCELILLCHGSGMVVSKTSWIGTLLKLPKALVQEGFAVFDCNGYSPSDGNSWGCPKAMQNYLKAYEYVTTHYNVKKHIHSCGISMGGLVALNFAFWYKSIVKSVGIMAPVIDLFQEGWNWDSGRKQMIADAYGFTGTTTYEADKVVGCDPMLRAIEISSQKYVPHIAPLKIWQGTADTAVTPSISSDYYQYVRNTGNYAEYSEIEGGTHEIWGVDAVNADVADWFSNYSN